MKKEIFNLATGKTRTYEAKNPAHAVRLAWLEDNPGGDIPKVIQGSHSVACGDWACLLEKKGTSIFASLQKKADTLGFELSEVGGNYAVHNPDYPRKRIYAESEAEMHEILDHMLYAKNLLAE